MTDLLQLPVSGLELELSLLTGADELLLLEREFEPLTLSLELLRRLAQTPYNTTGIDWLTLTLTDRDAFLLKLRRAIVGERIQAVANCVAPDCNARIDISFDIRDYLAFHAPQCPRGVRVDAETGWYRWHNGDVLFRLPTIGDLLAVAGQSEPQRLLSKRCIRPDTVGSAQRRRIESAMEALAPSLSNDLSGQCSECGTVMELEFDVARFCLRELRDQARFLFDDIHRIALAYHWTEQDILALPSTRRVRYVERLSQTESHLK